jgi:hypothetical protein
VIAVTQAANTASLRLLARLGFVERERFVEFEADQVLLMSSVVSTALSLAACPLMCPKAQ